MFTTSNITTNTVYKFIGPFARHNIIIALMSKSWVPASHGYIGYMYTLPRWFQDPLWPDKQLKPVCMVLPLVFNFGSVK